jgi:hypothetical protein
MNGNSCPLETRLEFHGRFKQGILAGTKRISLRLGARRFAKSIEVEGYHAIVNLQYVAPLRRIPFSIFWDEGWDNVENMLKSLNEVYPGATLDSMFTVVEFRLEIPHRMIEK